MIVYHGDITFNADQSDTDRAREGVRSQNTTPA